MDIIIGGGITGLSYAYFNRERKPLLLERDATLGGYCRTTRRNGFVWDYSGHFFHFQDPAVKDMVTAGMDASALVEVNKQTHIRYKDLMVDYPFQKNIHQLPKEELLDCLYDLFAERSREYTNFEEMLYAKFGKSIAEKFLIPYNEKLYACHLNTLDKDAMGRFFPYAEKEEIIRNFRQGSHASYNGSFVYPRQGAVAYVDSIVTRLAPATIRCGSQVVRICPERHTVVLSSGEELHYDRLVSTMPFPVMLKMAGVEYDESVYTWNQVLNFNLGFDRKGPDTVNHWIYFPEKQYCFYRVGFYDNILRQDRMSLYVELGFPKQVAVRPHEWLGRVLTDLRRAGVVSDDQVLVDYESIVMNPAYVHINARSLADVAEKKAQLAEWDIYSIGRYGSWTYCSIEDNIKEAKELTRQIYGNK